MVLFSHHFISQEVAEPLMDLKKGIESLQKNKTFKYILSAILGIGNFLNGAKVTNYKHSNTKSLGQPLPKTIVDMPQ